MFQYRVLREDLEAAYSHDWEFEKRVEGNLFITNEFFKFLLKMCETNAMSAVSLLELIYYFAFEREGKDNFDMHGYKVNGEAGIYRAKHFDNPEDKKIVHITLEDGEKIVSKLHEIEKDTVIFIENAGDGDLVRGGLFRFILHNNELCVIKDTYNNIRVSAPDSNCVSFYVAYVSLLTLMGQAMQRTHTDKNNRFEELIDKVSGLWEEGEMVFKLALLAEVAED